MSFECKRMEFLLGQYLYQVDKFDELTGSNALEAVDIHLALERRVLGLSEPSDRAEIAEKGTLLRIELPKEGAGRCTYFVRI
jgi:hypothetical protein